MIDLDEKNCLMFCGVLDAVKCSKIVIKQGYTNWNWKEKITYYCMNCSKKNILNKRKRNHLADKTTISSHVAYSHLNSRETLSRMKKMKLSLDSSNMINKRLIEKLKLVSNTLLILKRKDDLISDMSDDVLGIATHACSVISAETLETKQLTLKNTVFSILNVNKLQLDNS